MKALWLQFWSVCRMSRGPEDIPHSLKLLLLVLLLDVGLGITVQWLDGPASLQAAVGMTALAAALDALVLWALVQFKNVPERYLQGLTTIYGTDFQMGLLSLPLVAAGLYLAKVPWLPVIAFAQMLLVGWSLGVRAFVYHRTLMVGVILANMLSFTLFLLTVFIVLKLFPELVPVAAGS